MHSLSPCPSGSTSFFLGKSDSSCKDRQASSPWCVCVIIHVSYCKTFEGRSLWGVDFIWTKKAEQKCRWRKADSGSWFPYSSAVVLSKGTCPGTSRSLRSGTKSTSCELPTDAKVSCIKRMTNYGFLNSRINSNYLMFVMQNVLLIILNNSRRYVLNDIWGHQVSYTHLYYPLAISMFYFSNQSSTMAKTKC